MAVDIEAIQRLVAKYEALSKRDRHSYKEAETRTNFIDPLFLALGWDVYDRQEVEREAKTETGLADYAFKIGGAVRFYLEAKPLDDDIHKTEYAKKAITYAYNKGVAWAVLCSFAGLQVFNAEWQTTDLNSTRVLSLTSSDFSQPDSPLLLLSRDAFLKGELEKHAQKWSGVKPRLPVAKSLFEQLRQWRGQLFAQIRSYRQDLTLQQVDEAVLRLLNRLIFIRNCEDRRIEEAKLRAALNKWKEGGSKGELVEVLRGLFSEFDASYDSDLFNLALADQVFVESVALTEIVEGLYAPPGSLAAYDFSVMDADVLGQVYEQYLGYVAREEKTQAARQRSLADLGFEVKPVELEAKRLKRKAHGIYYTPKWVVDYIVGQTVGRYLETKSHNDVLSMKILDPACGSGSFLIRAFDTLLNYHATVEGKSARELQGPERWRILTDNIFGVDLDPQAVEIARLNLLLRAVARRELLPGLAENVVRGNSLISGKQEELKRYFGKGWREKQPFDWGKQFPQIMRDGGFDVVIGNPPYVRIQTIAREEADYYRDHFESAHGAFDLYVLFVEQGLKLLKDGGLLGFITSGKFLKSEYGKRLRTLLHEKCCVRSIVDLSDHADVFGDSTSYPVIIVIENRKGRSPLRYVLLPGDVSVGDATVARSLNHDYGQDVSQDGVVAGAWPPPRGEKAVLMHKLASSGPRLAEISAHVFQGLITSADKVYTVLRRGVEQGGRTRAYSRALGKEYILEDSLLHPLVQGKAVSRYRVSWADEMLIFPYDTSCARAQLIPISVLERQYPLVLQYLEGNRDVLQSREKGKMRGEGWYGYSRIQNMCLHGQRKLVVPRLVYHLEAAYDSDGVWYLDNVDVGGIILRDSSDKNYKYVLGLLNSRLLDFYFRQFSAPFRGQYRSANRQFIASLPIKQINPKNQSERQVHDRLVTLVGQMLELHERVGAKGEVRDDERAQIEREIERTDREIDALVYDLYGLTAEERAMVEGEQRELI